MAIGYPQQTEDGDARRSLDPIPLIGLVAEAAEFPIDAFSGSMRGATEAIGSMAQVPLAMAAASILSAVSLAVQGHADVKLPTGAFRPTSLFFLTIAASGARKSTADDKAMEAVADFQRDLNEKYVQEKAARSVELDAWNESRKVAINQNKGGGKALLEAALRDLGPKPPEPMEPVIIVRSGTTQGLIKMMDKARPSLGLMSDEGGSYLGGYAMTDDAKLHTYSTLSDFWDGKPVWRLTSGEGNSLLYGRRLSFHLMVQPAVASQLLGDPLSKEQGFLSRILITQPASLAGTRFIEAGKVSREGDEIKLKTFHTRLRHILDAPLPFDQAKNALMPTHLWIDQDAERLWVDFFNECERRVCTGGDLEEISGFVGKVAEHAARLAAVLVMFDEGRSAKKIGPMAMERGIKLARFYLSEALRLIGTAPVSPLLRQAQHLSEWLKTKWNENLIAVTTLMQHGPLRKLNADDHRKIMEVLERHYHVVKLPDGGMVKGKRRQEAWRIVRQEAPHEA